MSKTHPTGTVEMANMGAGPSTLIRNLFDLKRRSNNIYHITGDVHYMAIATGKNSVLTIHDVKSAKSGNPLKDLYIKLFWFWLPAIFVKRITVISNFTRIELEQIIPFAKHKIRVVYNPIKGELKPTTYNFRVEKPRILLIGTKPNKNLERTFEALEKINCDLTIVGKLSENQLELLKKHNLQFTNKMNLPYSEIITCYENCDMLCFASTYEGFGMPIIEAQSIGRPVLTSEIGAMLEVANDSACLVNPYNVNSIRDGIQRILADEAYRHNLIEQGFENVKRFQLQNIVNQYINVYKEI